MNTLEILEYLSDIPNHTVGVFAADEIPKKWGKPAAFVFNTDDHTKPGHHWVSVYVDKKNNKGWFFDSYGLPPIVPNHSKCLRKNCKHFEWNTKRLQSDTSEVCGHYCIMFLNYMSEGSNVKKFLENFSDNFIKNDEIVRNYISRNKRGNKRFVGYGSWNVRNLQRCNAKLSVIT